MPPPSLGKQTRMTLQKTYNASASHTLPTISGMLSMVDTSSRPAFADYAANVVTSPYGKPVKFDTDTSHTSLSSINAQLMTHGWAKRPLNLDALSDKDHADVLAVLFDLIGASIANLSTLDDLSARHRTLGYEQERLTKQFNHVQIGNKRLETEVTGWKARCADVERRREREEAKVKDLREEVARSRKAIDGVRVAAGNENKKVQLKLDKANVQLAKQANDASLLSRPQGLVLLNPISGERSYPTAPAQPALFEQSVKDLAEIRQSLQEETEAFRHVVVSTGNGLREAMASAAGDEEPTRLLSSQFFSVPANDPLARSLTHQSASSTAHPTVADARLKSLIAEIRKKLIDGVVRTQAVSGSDIVQVVMDREERQRETREKERARMELEEKIKDLEVEVTCAKAREEKANQLVDELAKMQADAESSKAIDRERYRDDSDDLRKQKYLLEQERRKFTEAASRLGQERRQLESDRAAFVTERRKADRDDLQAFLPPTPVASGEPELDAGGPSSPNPASWPMTRSMSPSPLSPAHAKPRTPKAHSAGKRRTKTPLSRLVLEKAARAKGKETATAWEMDRLKSNMLGEGGRKGNVEGKGKVKAAASGVTGGRSISESKGAGSSTSSSAFSSALSSSGKSLGGSVAKSTTTAGGLRWSPRGMTTTLKPSINLGTSTSKPNHTGPTRPHVTNGTSGMSQTEKDLTVMGGVGPRGAAKGNKVWR